MKCKCGKEAIEIIRKPMCNTCFSNYYTSRIRDFMKKYRVVKSGERVLVAISGGKDSVALLDVMFKLSNKLDYEIEALHINLGIGEYSENSQRICRDLCKLLDVKLNIINLSEYGFTISDIKRKPCSVCGNVKRYLMNKFARENGFDVVATGHCSEDILANFFKNLYSGNLEWSEKLKPRIDGYDKFVAKIKPLYEIGEKENLLYVLSENLPFLAEECPKAPDAKWKELIYEIERKFPGFKRNVLRNLLKDVKSKRMSNYRYCKLCGEMTISEICQFCRNVMKFGKIS